MTNAHTTCVGVLICQYVLRGGSLHWLITKGDLWLLHTLEWKQLLLRMVDFKGWIE
jgi:hypothetical protein